ncbi:Glycosyltransferase involved in cell wall bisynthesis [Lachnospiraceae bacterium]|nr:Glycosyltransferase involved in cell wall bisynthesis [Lachnospiraceae bacterium]
MEKLVSVIIPMYNAELYISRCLDSVVQQTYRNIEILLLNDGSTDRSEEICSFFVNDDPRVKLINKKNSGQADTRNQGLELAKGDYILFVDSDDYLAPDLIENSLREMELYRSDLVIFNYYHVYSGNGVEKVCPEREFFEGAYTVDTDEERLKFITNSFLNYRCGFELWNRLYRADIIREHNLRIPDFSPVMAEDLCFNLLYLLHASKIYVSNRRSYYYIRHDDSTVGKAAGVSQIDRYNDISKYVYEYVSDKGMDYFKDRFYMIHMLLIYHEIMDRPIREMKKLLRSVTDLDYCRKAIRSTGKNIVPEIEIMGAARGTKYFLLAGILSSI